jgi:pyruvate formate lyase activating enzyme
MNDKDIRPLSKFIASIDPSLPVCFLAFRPNFVLEGHPGAGTDLMESCVRIAREEGLTDVSWSGRTDLPGRTVPVSPQVADKYQTVQARNLATYALKAGCGTHPRDCAKCKTNQKCRIKRYKPRIST